MNAVRFAHQSLGNPKISTLLKAVRRGFLQGCPNMNARLILKYLNPSPATAKGHMKRPRQGIQSTTPCVNTTPITIEVAPTHSTADDNTAIDLDDPWDFVDANGLFDHIVAGL
jgi:hypothetical protein